MAFLGISGFFENIGIILEDMWSCKLRTFLSLFGIMWGTISVVLLLSLGQSFYQTSQVRLSPLVDGAIAGMPGFTGKAFNGLPKRRQINLKAKDVVELKKVIPGIKTSSPVIRGSDGYARFSRNSLSSYGMISGVDGDYLDSGNILPMPGGRHLNFQDIENKRQVVFLGSDIANVLFPHGENPIGNKVYFKGIPLLVVGVQVKDRPASWANRIAFIPYSTYIEFFGDQNISYFWIMPKVSDNADNLQNNIVKYWSRKFHFNPEDKQAINIFDLRKAFDFFQWFFKSINLFLGFCGLLTLAVGGISVANMMFLIVTERTPEIGLKLALGAKDKHILVQVLLEAFVIVFLGGLLGFLVSSLVLISLADISLGGWLGTPSLSVPVLIGTVIVLAFVALLSGFFPALRASRLQPVEALSF